MKELKGRDMNFNTVIIGCGRIARAHANAIAATPGAQLRAVYDSDERAGQAMANEYGVAMFTNMAAMLREVRPAIAVICTPPTTHAAIAIACLEAGVHVLCEKPLGVSEAEVAAMNAAALKAQRTLMMASKFRFVPAVRELKERIAAGEFGDLLQCRIQFLGEVDMNGRMNSHRQLSGGGVVMDNGPHAFDLAHFLLGPISRVRGELLPRVQDLDVEDGAIMRFEVAQHPSLCGEVRLSWSLPSTAEFVQLYGTSKTASLTWSEYDKNAAFALQMAHFVSIAQGNCEPEISQEDAVATACLIDTVYRHIASSKDSE